MKFPVAFALFPLVTFYTLHAASAGITGLGGPTASFHRAHDNQFPVLRRMELGQKSFNPQGASRWNDVTSAGSQGAVQSCSGKDKSSCSHFHVDLSPHQCSFDPKSRGKKHSNYPMSIATCSKRKFPSDFKFWQTIKCRNMIHQNKAYNSIYSLKSQVGNKGSHIFENHVPLFPESEVVDFRMKNQF